MFIYYLGVPICMEKSHNLGQKVIEVLVGGALLLGTASSAYSIIDRHTPIKPYNVDGSSPEHVTNEVYISRDHAVLYGVDSVHIDLDGKSGIVRVYSSKGKLKNGGGTFYFVDTGDSCTTFYGAFEMFKLNSDKEYVPKIAEDFDVNKLNYERVEKLDDLCIDTRPWD